MISEMPALTDYDALERFCLEKAAESGEVETESDRDLRLSRELDERRQRGIKAMWNYRIRISGLPSEFEFPRTKWEEVPGTEKMIDACSAYIKTMQECIKRGAGILIIGKTPGTGKTRTISRVGFELLKSGYSVIFITSEVLSEELSTESFEEIPYRNELIENLCKVDFLIIDDFGNGAYTARGLSRLKQIIDRRWLAKKGIGITGNWESFSEMQKGVKDDRIFSRLNDNAFTATNNSNSDMRLK